MPLLTVCYGIKEDKCKGEIRTFPIITINNRMIGDAGQQSIYLFWWNNNHFDVVTYKGYRLFGVIENKMSCNVNNVIVTGGEGMECVHIADLSFFTRIRYFKVHVQKHTKATIQSMICVLICAIFCVCELFGIQNSCRFCFGIAS